jgi:hypothetical protein
MNEKKYDLTSGALPIGIVISVVLSVIGGTAVAVKTMADVSNEIQNLRQDMMHRLEMLQRDQSNTWTRSQMEAWAWQLAAQNATIQVPEVKGQK